MWNSCISHAWEMLLSCTPNRHSPNHPQLINIFLFGNNPKFLKPFKPKNQQENSPHFSPYFVMIKLREVIVGYYHLYYRKGQCWLWISYFLQSHLVLHFSKYGSVEYCDKQCLPWIPYFLHSNLGLPFSKYASVVWWHCEEKLDANQFHRYGKTTTT